LFLFLQSAGNSSALFLTAAAQNLLCLKLAQELGVSISNPWVSWFKAASVPAFVALMTTPFLLYKIFPPDIKETPEAPAAAEKKLQAMGPITQNEWFMVSTMLLAVTLWVFGYTTLYHSLFLLFHQGPRPSVLYPFLSWLEDTMQLKSIFSVSAQPNHLRMMQRW
jgi:di/tricarboxylate transporter